MEYNGRMLVKVPDPTNHQVYGYVNQEYFFKGIQRAKIEDAFVDDEGHVDIGLLIRILWETYADGRYCVLPNKLEVKPEVKKETINYLASVNSGLYNPNGTPCSEKIIEKPKRSHKKKIVLTEEQVEEAKVSGLEESLD